MSQRPSRRLLRAPAGTRRALCLALALLPVVVFGQYNTVLGSPGAAEQLRMGVQAYHRGRYAESILLLEKSLAYAPNEQLLQYWLGRAYAKSGFAETALRAWQGLLQEPGAPAFLRAKAEYLSASRSLRSASPDYRYVEAMRFLGQRGRDRLFLRPSLVLPRRDGSLLVVAHGSNELLVLDASGVVKERIRGGLRGFDRPYGAAFLPDGTLFVAEFNGNRLARIAPDGSVKLIGAKGRGAGELIGPQYVAADAEAGGDCSVYVTDYGNARVSKFDAEGGFLLSFGQRDPDTGFPGFVSPTGILVHEGVVFVCDSYRRSIYRFDPSGNYLGPLAEGELRAPEGLSLWEGGRSLLVADTVRVAAIDLGNEAVKEVYRPADKGARIVSAAPDYNGNLVLCDFDGSSVSVITESFLIASGYDVEIEGLNADSFPLVRVDLSVRDRRGSPVVGLAEGNFHLVERIRKNVQVDEAGKAAVRIEESIEPVAELNYLGSGQLAKGFRATILLERSQAGADAAESLRPALAELYGLLGGEGGPGLVTAGPSPAFETAGDLASATRIALSPPSGKGRFDLGLKLAATRLLPSRPRDAVVYLGTGDVDEASFSGTSLAELASLLAANGIRFYAVVLDQASPPLHYIAERTGGSIFQASRPRGLGDLADDLRSAPSGRYSLSFVSRADPVFGRAYLSVGVEAYLFKKSGADELGYYAPFK